MIFRRQKLRAEEENKFGIKQKTVVVIEELSIILFLFLGSCVAGIWINSRNEQLHLTDYTKCFFCNRKN